MLRQAQHERLVFPFARGSTRTLLKMSLFMFRCGPGRAMFAVKKSPGGDEALSMLHGLQQRSQLLAYHWRRRALTPCSHKFRIFSQLPFEGGVKPRED